MLVLTRKPNQSIVISSNIVLTVLEIDGERVKLGISAPRDVAILRQELADEITRENIQAAHAPGNIQSTLTMLKTANLKKGGNNGTS